MPPEPVHGLLSPFLNERELKNGWRQPNKTNAVNWYSYQFFSMEGANPTLCISKQGHAPGMPYYFKPKER
jgi:hypothetical protein